MQCDVDELTMRYGVHMDSSSTSVVETLQVGANGGSASLGHGFENGHILFDLICVWLPAQLAWT